jgi:hypothetical protein
MKRPAFLTSLIALTIISFGQTQTKVENLKIVWCEEYKWKIASNQENATTHFLEIIPGKEKIEKWTMLGTMMSLKNTKITKTEQVLEMYRQTSQKESPEAKLTVLESNDSAKNIWVLFKIETPSYPNDPKPESQLYYAIQGETTLYVNFIAVKEKTISKDFESKWTKVFKESELVYE